MENNYVERYLYDVVRRLPEKQRKDIEEELRTLIEDMLEERQGSRDSEESIKEVLSELGEPAKLAMKYRGEEAHLIGGEYYPLYCQLLKLVLICVGIGVGIASVVRFVTLFPAQGGTAGMVADGFVNGFVELAGLPNALLEAFGFVTLVFFIMERNQIKLQKKDSWSVENIPQIPSRKSAISKSDSIVGIVFGILIMVVFICLPELIGVWTKTADGELAVISVLNLAEWNKLLPLLIISISAGIADDFVKLVSGYYNKTVMYVSVACSILAIVMTSILFKGNQVFNVNFAGEFAEISGGTFSEKHDIIAQWSAGVVSSLWANIMHAGIVLIILIDLAVTVYRTLRYGQRGNEK